MSTQATLALDVAPPLKITGDDYRPHLDEERLATQFGRILELMLDGKWRTVDEIAHALKMRFPLNNWPENSVQAQLRNARKPENGGYTVSKRRRELNGLYEYQVQA